MASIISYQLLGQISGSCNRRRTVACAFRAIAYHRMFETGVLDSERRFELLDGEIVMMSPIGPNQSNVTSRLNEILCDATHRKRCNAGFSCPLLSSDHSEPEPDLAIVRRREGGYPTQHPGPADVVLLIEVAQSSLNIDLGLEAAALCNVWNCRVLGRGSRKSDRDRPS